MEEKNYRLADWINAQIEEKYRRELLTARNPKKVLRLSLRRLSKEMGYSGRESLMRVMNGGKGSNEFLRRLAAYFDAPEETVFRLAGELPPIDPRDEYAKQIRDLAEKMDPDIQELYLRIGQGMIVKKTKTLEPVLGD